MGVPKIRGAEIDRVELFSEPFFLVPVFFCGVAGVG